MTDFNAILPGAKDKFENAGNKTWWENNPMVYDWDRTLGEVAPSKKYYQGIDDIAAEGHRLCGNPNWPNGFFLDHFVPYGEVAGKKVLEIGCGAGLLASHLAKNGAILSAVDLTEAGVQLTRRRFELEGLTGDIRQMDAEKLAFADATFDYVVSWGVIHHSGNMQAILDQIQRVLKPGGKAYLMVYNRSSLRYQVYCRVWLGVARMRLLKASLEKIAGSITDGFIARHLTTTEFRKMAHGFSDAKFSFSDEENTTLAYLVGPLRRLLPKREWARETERKLAARWGWYLQAVLTK